MNRIQNIKSRLLGFGHRVGVVLRQLMANPLPFLSGVFGARRTLLSPLGLLPLGGFTLFSATLTAISLTFGAGAFSQPIVQWIIAIAGILFGLTFVVWAAGYYYYYHKLLSPSDREKSDRHGLRPESHVEEMSRLNVQQLEYTYKLALLQAQSAGEQQVSPA